jgi:hypothetical protein
MISLLLDIAALERQRAAAQKQTQDITTQIQRAKDFGVGFEEVEAALKSAGKGWFSLKYDPATDWVWLNPYEQEQYNSGWYDLDDLVAWINDESPIVKRAK